MPGLSDTYENNVLNAILGAGFVKPATIYVALFNVAPEDATFGTEVSGPGYARVALTNNVANWPAAAGGVKSNGVAVTFPAATGAWTNAIAWGLMDSAAGVAAANVITSALLASPRLVVSGEQPEFPIGSLVVAAD